MRNGPMTTEELFNTIKEILEEKGKLPEILEYGEPTYHPIPIKTYEFDLKNNLDYGVSEGIYLDLWMEYYVDGEAYKASIGTFKTLDKSGEGMHRMAALLADFIIEEEFYVNSNLDDFKWEGADVYPFDEAGKRLPWSYSFCSKETAIKRRDELLEKYPQVVIRDNATRKEKIYIRSDQIQRQAGPENIDKNKNQD